jgi:hypothetical protein
MKGGKGSCEGFSRTDWVFVSSRLSASTSQEDPSPGSDSRSSAKSRGAHIALTYQIGGLASRIVVPAGCRTLVTFEGAGLDATPPSSIRPEQPHPATPSPPRTVIPTGADRLFLPRSLPANASACVVKESLFDSAPTPFHITPSCNAH